ncbi:MAG: CCA tRNA nucleotidyltransferase [Candidatus Burarchaeum sp.]|nr:CCA tRNA nucleotidyltransferase [Candidatus Burarchaeum sp.]MDO8339693.1 CCA tRNA nucleotidyltransferase [Candidatus Burarchaeum sp.]
MPASRKKTVYMPGHDLDDICARVIEWIRPDETEISRERKEIEKLLLRMRALIPAEIGIELAGSMAKGTNLRSALEFDIFMLFPKHYTLKDLEVLGLEWAKKAVAPHKWHVGYAEHPYLNARVGNADVDIVPSFKITSAEEMQSSVDRSQLHTHYILRNMNDRQKDDVRLLKQFMKAIGAYGAELRVGGFSGYLCELLILRYGTFRKLVEEAATWQRPVIDIEKSYGEHELAKSFSEPLIVIDPVDRKRNVAAAVSRTTLSKFIIGAQTLLKNPSEEKFFPKREVGEKERLRREIRSRSTELVGMIFSAPKAVPDVLWPQLKKASTNIGKQLGMNGFSLISSELWTDEKKRCALLFELEVHMLPNVVKVSGPEVHFDMQVENFVKAHRGSARKIWVEDSRIVALEKRKFSDAAGLIRHIARNPDGYGIPEKMQACMRRGRLAKGEALLRLVPLEVIHRFLLGEEL